MTETIFLDEVERPVLTTIALRDSEVPEDAMDSVRVLWLRRCAHGDTAALQALYIDVSPQLYGVLLAILRRRDLAEDVLQEVFVSVWRNAPAYCVARGTPMAWMSSIARYRAFDLLRHRELRSPRCSSSTAVGETEILEVDASYLASQAEDSARLTRCMGCLSANQVKAVKLAYVCGLTHREIADQIGSPIGTVKSWIRRGLQDLRHCLES